MVGTTDAGARMVKGAVVLPIVVPPFLVVTSTVADPLTALVI